MRRSQYQNYQKIAVEAVPAEYYPEVKKDKELEYYTKFEKTLNPIDELAEKLKEEWKWNRVSHLPDRILSALRIDPAEYDNECYNLHFSDWQRIARVWDKPVKFNTKDIDEMVNSLPDDAFEYRPPIKTEFIPPIVEEVTVVQEISNIANKIRNRDTNFQNLNTEIEKAQKYADEAVEDFARLTKYISQVEEKDAERVIEILKVMDHPYMRVYGDRLKYKVAPEYPDGLERALKTLYWDKSLRIKLHRHQTKEILKTIEVSRRYELSNLMDYNIEDLPKPTKKSKRRIYLRNKS